MKHETAEVSLYYHQDTPVAKIVYYDLIKIVELPLDQSLLNKEIKYWEDSFNVDYKRAINMFWASKGWGFTSKEDELASQLVYMRYMNESNNPAPNLLHHQSEE